MGQYVYFSEVNSPRTILETIGRYLDFFNGFKKNISKFIKGCVLRISCGFKDPNFFFFTFDKKKIKFAEDNSARTILEKSRIFRDTFPKIHKGHFAMQKLGFFRSFKGFFLIFKKKIVGYLLRIANDFKDVWKMFKDSKKN